MDTLHKNMWILLSSLKILSILCFQEVLKELINEKLPKLSAHFSAHGVDPTLFTLNWFLCLFVDDPLPVKTYLHIWDAFLFEGSKVSNVYHSLKIDINTI